MEKLRTIRVLVVSSTRRLPAQERQGVDRGFNVSDPPHEEGMGTTGHTPRLDEDGIGFLSGG